MHASVPVPGSIVWIRQRPWRVERARREHDVIRLDVASRDRRLTFLAPFDRPAMTAGQTRAKHVSTAHARARMAGAIAATYGVRTILAARDARIDLLPHQLEPVLDMLNGTRRLLLADEVGLGKTIQAGLVIAEILRRRLPARVLVLAPAGLRDQWRDELAARFNIHAEIADRQALDDMTRQVAFGDNPWHRAGVWIASPDYLKQQHVLDAIPFLPWDLVVIDEAHEAAGDSERHRVSSEMARRARRVLLLSATPHSGDETRFARLLQIGRVHGVSDTMKILRRTRAELNVRRDRRVHWARVQPAAEEQLVLDVLTRFERIVLDRLGQTRRESALLLLSVFRKRALSTMAALERSIERRLAWIDERNAPAADWLQPHFDFDTASADDLDDRERHALLIESGLTVTEERPWLRRLLALTAAARRRDTKIERIARRLLRAREPAVVFTEVRHSLEAVCQRLERSRRLAVMHGGLADADRRRALDRFLAGDADVLVATDVAGQGLNLQRAARWVISLELPWNPARIEQRVGRVDRIGQTRRVHLTLMTSRHDAEAGVLSRLAVRALAAQRAMPAAVAETSVAMALIAGGGEAALITPPREIPVADRRWSRPARVATRGLERRRTLAACWRGPALEATRVLWTSRGLGGGARALFDVPLANGAGEVVERHIVGVALRGDFAIEAPRLPPALLDAALVVIKRRLSARARRLGRWLRQQADEATAAERAIAAHLHALRYPDEAQAGIFDRRETRAFDAARHEAQGIQRALSERLRTAADETRIEIGEPRLLLVCGGRR